MKSTATQQTTTHKVELSTSELAILEYIRDIGPEYLAGAINDVYNVAAFHFPDHLSYQKFQESFLLVHELSHRLKEKTGNAW